MKIYDSTRREAFGKRLETLRIATKQSRASVAAQLNISTSAYAWYETGQRDPTIDTLNSISKIFNVSIDYLVNGQKNFTVIDLQSAKVFWESANFKIIVEDDNSSLIIADLSNISVAGKDGLVTLSLNQKIRFENVHAFLFFTQNVYNNFLSASQSIRRKVCEKAIEEAMKPEENSNDVHCS